MLMHFGWEAALSILLSTAAVSFIFRKEFIRLSLDVVTDEQISSSSLRIPFWVQALHLVFLLGVVIAAHHAVVFLGLFFGRLLCAIVEWKSIIDLPADIYMLSRLHIEIRIAEWVSIVCIAIILAIASTLWPSYKMSKESPVEGLRYE
jgi:hypothetical protein